MAAVSSGRARRRVSDDWVGRWLLVLIALVITVMALIGRWSPIATKLSAALFGLMIVQFILGVSGAGTSPVLGGLHAVNALAIYAAAGLLAHRAWTRRPAAEAAA